MSDKTPPGQSRPPTSGTSSSSRSDGHDEHEFSVDVERSSAEFSGTTSTDDLESQRQVVSASKAGGGSSSSSSGCEMVTTGNIPVISKWRWIGEKELQYLVTNRKTPPPPAPPPPPPGLVSATTQLGNEPESSSSAAAPAEASVEDLEKGAFVRVVTEGVGTQSSSESGGDGGRQTIAHILLPAAAESEERGQPGNPESPLHKERGLFVEAGAVVAGKKRKVSCVADDCSSNIGLHHDREAGVVSYEATTGGAATASAADHDGDEEPLCRVCHMSTASLMKTDVIDLGCACKLDLGRAHRECAETWFQVRGNRQCEICGETAQNVRLLGPANENAVNDPDTTITVVTVHHRPSSCWQNRPIRNFLLVFLVAAFLIPWLFRFAYYS